MRARFLWSALDCSGATAAMDDHTQPILLARMTGQLFAPVRVGVIDAERAELLSGVAAGDLVVRGEAVTRLGEGARVEVPEDGARVSTAQRKPAS